MPDYHVTWEIELYADTPEDAARQARKMQLDPDSIGDVFEVIEIGGDGTSRQVDLFMIDEENGGEEYGQSSYTRHVEGN